MKDQKEKPSDGDPNPATKPKTKTKRKGHNDNDPFLAMVVMSTLCVILLAVLFVSKLILDPPGKPAETSSEEDARVKLLEAQIKELKRQQAGGGSENVCGLYLAQSSIPGVDTFGIFAGQTLNAGDALEIMGAFSSLSKKSTQCFAPSKMDIGINPILGSILQHHPTLNNVQPCRTDQDAPRYKVTHDMVPGQELLINYEDLPTHDMDTVPWLRNAPRKQTYETVNGIVSDMMNMKPGRKTRTFFPGGDKKPFPKANILDLMKKSIARIDPRVSNLIPDAEISAYLIHAAGSARMTVSNRTLDWLESHGQCIDTIISKRSTLPRQVTGAFSKRTMLKGDVIIPVPLLVTMKGGEIDATEIGKDGTVDMCFGNDQSPLLLCPTLLATLIHHQSPPEQTETDDECTSGPNAEYRWSPWNQKNTELANVAVKDFDDVHYIHGYSLDIVATRKIELNEEIFIDYEKTLESDGVGYRIQCIKRGIIDDLCKEFRKID